VSTEGGRYRGHFDGLDELLSTMREGGGREGVGEGGEGGREGGREGRTASSGDLQRALSRLLGFGALQWR